ncbi:MarR family transcriptional regulator [Anabaena sp. CCY 9402-a]|uniref:MarR family transcriptional regulator n=1 Tax=Anabaena sp. CCY 9402-a TaxID=3103867 RepID=UPI0039C7217E
MTHYFIRSIGQRVQSWFTQVKNTEIDQALVELPDTIQTQLILKIQALPSPKAYQTNVQEAIANAINTWQQNLDAPNNLVVLANPVEAIAKILGDSLKNWQDTPVQVITPLTCLNRPCNPLKITQQIQQALTPYQQVDTTNSRNTDDQLNVESLEQRTTLIVIPCLEQCFLRCIGGWDGIEYLRDVAIHNRNCFWIMGCNQWAWDFLDFVCQISSYFSEVEALPAIDGAMLQVWLDPIAKTVLDTSDLENSDGDRTNEERHKSYWDSLASQSSGVSSIAANLWLESLRVSQADMEDNEPNQPTLTKTGSEKPITLHETNPSLPNLPPLTAIDRYLLHSVLIHGQITRAHLALSLGESESHIQAHIQRLLRAGLLERGNGALSVRASHYTRLKNELANNNFFVGKN